MRPAERSSPSSTSATSQKFRCTSNPTDLTTASFDTARQTGDAWANDIAEHRKGTPDLDELRPFAGPGDRELVQRCALLVCPAELLEIEQNRSVRGAQLVPNGRAVQLWLRLGGGDRLVCWSVSGGWARRPSAVSLATCS
jgi:hypothetical protein